MSFFGFRHFLKRQHMLPLFGDGSGEQLAGLAGRIVQRIIEPALDGGGAFARAEPSIEAGVGEGDGDDGRDDVNTDQ